MPRLCCQKGKRLKRLKNTSPSSAAGESEYITSSDWIQLQTTTAAAASIATQNLFHHHHPTTTTTANSSPSSTRTTTTTSAATGRMDLHVNTSSSITNNTMSQKRLRQIQPPSFLSPENVASVPPPGLSAPSQPIFLYVPKDNDEDEEDSNNETERIVLSYVAVQPKVSYPSTHRTRTSNNNGIRSLYRPLTTTTIGGSTTNNPTSPTRTTTTSVTTSTDNNGTTTMMYTGSNGNIPSPTPSTTNPKSLSYFQNSTSSMNQSNGSNISSSNGAINPNPNNTNNNNNTGTSTERVLMCYELAPTQTTKFDHSNENSKLNRDKASLDIAVDHRNQQQNNNHNNNTSTIGTDDFSQRSSSGLDLPQQQQQQQQPVPLLRWQSNLSSLFGRAVSTNSNNHSKNADTTLRKNLISESVGSSNSSNNSMNDQPSFVSNTTNRVATGNAISSSTNNNYNHNNSTIPLEERLLRERLKAVPSSASGSLTQFHYANVVSQKRGRDRNNGNDCSRQSNESNSSRSHIRLLIPARGSLYIQDGIDTKINDLSSRRNDDITCHNSPRCICIHDKSTTGMSATDAQLSPDGTMVAWTYEGEIYVQSAEPRTFDASLLHKFDTGTASLLLDDSFIAAATSTTTPVIRISFGATQTDSCCITHGVADFVAQEEMDRYRGFWWHPNSNAILFTRNDESEVPVYRIMHQSNSSTLPSFSSSQQHTDHSSSQHYESNSSSYNGILTTPTPKNTNTSAFEDHRYPFAGKLNPTVQLGLVRIDRESVLDLANSTNCKPSQHLRNTLISECSEQREGIDADDANFYCYNSDDDCNTDDDRMQISTSQDIAGDNWSNCTYFDAPTEADEYLARVHILPDGRAIAQWQNRTQTCSILYLLDLNQPRFLPSSEGIATGQILVVERSDIWINLHHMFYLLPRALHPNEIIGDKEMQIIDMPYPLPAGSFTFIFASERTGYAHLYLYTYCPGVNNNEAVLIRCLTSGNWSVENILGVDLEKDVVYFAGTYDSVLERHLYAAPILNAQNKHTWRFGSNPTPEPPVSSDTLTADGTLSQSTSNSKTSTFEDSTSHGTPNGKVRRGLSKVMHVLSGKLNGGVTGSNIHRHEQIETFFTSRCDKTNACPSRLTLESGMHSIVMDDKCRYFVDTSSDVDRPTTVKIYELPTSQRMTICWKATIYNAAQDDLFTTSSNVPNEYKTNNVPDMVKCLPAPELISFPTSDGTETLHAALYQPNPQLFGPGPYPLICAVYGGPHVQRVNRSWSQSSDMRAQRLRSLGFCVVKCDNRGSSRRGLTFESAISRRLGRLEVLDQVAAVRQLVVRGIADPLRVGVYGWSYGGYLSAMCLCRAPDVFHVAVAGAPVTSWDGYDTHYTERYMGLPTENPSGYRESAVFDHVPNMRGKLMIVHGLIDENVHFRHTTRLINKLIAAGKDYDLLIFPEERHSPRRLRDRIYMEQRISEYFVRHLNAMDNHDATSDVLVTAAIEQSSTQGLRPMAGHL